MDRIELKKKAIKLRQDGYSYFAINKKLGIAKSTLSDWLSEIPYKPNKETLERIGKARTMTIEAKRLKKQKSIVNANNLAISDIGNFSKRDLFMLGIGIYIGEGSKIQGTRISNSDPKIIKTAIIWFKEILNLQNSNFSIRIHLYPDNNQGKAIVFWSKESGLPRSCFLKCWIDTRSDKKKKNGGKLPFGTAHVTIKSNGRVDLGVNLARRISAWIDIVHKKAGVV